MVYGGKETDRGRDREGGRFAPRGGFYGIGRTGNKTFLLPQGAFPCPLCPQLFLLPLTKTQTLSPRGLHLLLYSSLHLSFVPPLCPPPQAQFFDRVYDIGPEVYAPLLACVIPVGGIIGGVGGGLVADRLGTGWGRAWLTSAANLAAAPVLALSIMADDYQTSLMYLTVGFALSEAWRAPSAVLVREQRLLLPCLRLPL